MKKNLLCSLVCFGIIYTSSAFAAGVTTHKIPTQTSQIPHVDVKKKTIAGLVILNDYYARDEKNIYTVNADKTGWLVIDGADRETFKVLLGRFAQDNDTIFSLGKPLEGVDRKSFVVISGTHGYASDDTIIYGPNGPIQGSDPETFRLYTGKYGADAGHVYYMGKTIDADSSTFEVMNAGPYAHDADKVFYNGVVLTSVPVEGFVVKGERAFASDGRVLFEGRVEKGAPLPDAEVAPETTDAPVSPDTPPTLISGETLINKLFAPDGVLTPYKTALTLEWPFLAYLVGVIIAIFSALFVFFAERNDESASWLKTFFKTLIALLVGGVIFWLATYRLSLLTSSIVGGVGGVIIFLSLSHLGGKIKTLFITLLAAIAFGFFTSLSIIILRTLSSTPHTILDFITQDTFQILSVLGGLGIFVGTWLIKTQLKTSTAGAVSGALIATLASLLIVVFVYWLGPLPAASLTLLFSLLFGAFVWVLSFRLNQTLLLTSVRVLRVMILLGMLCFVIVWFVV